MTLKIAIIGQSPFGESVAKRIQEIQDTEIVCIIPPFNNKEDPLYKFSNEQKIRTLQFKKLRSKEAIEAFNNINIDILIMAYVVDIVPIEIINYPKLGTIQYHPSLLPKHRGPSSINWSIINGDKETGITIFWPDRGLDTGDILIQKRIMIKENDSTGSLYFNSLYSMGVDAIVESINLIINGDLPKIPQIEKYATYEGWCKEQEIKWKKNPKDIYNLIRGCDPQPGAWTLYKGEKIYLYDTKLVSNNVQKENGTILFIDEKEVSVSIGNKKLIIGRIKSKGKKKINAYEWMVNNKIKPFSKLGE